MPTPAPAERRRIIRGAIECVINLNGSTRTGQTKRLTAAVWRIIEPALTHRDDQITAVHARIDAMAQTPELRQWADTLRAALRTRPGPLPPAVWCGASLPGYGAEPIGPCVLRHGHDGPVHQAASGAKWWPEQTLTVRDLTPPRRISTELVDEAEAGGGSLYAKVMRMFGGPLPPHEPAPLCWCGAQPFAGGVIHNTGCAWGNWRVPADPAPLRDLAARALAEEQPAARRDPRADDPAYDGITGYRTLAEVEADPPQFTGILGPLGITPDRCRAEYHRPGYPDARCDLPGWHPDFHRDQTITGTFRWDDSVATYPTTTPEDGQ